MPLNDREMLDIAYVQDSFNAFTESIEAHFEHVARSLQDAFPWLPQMKPAPKPPSRLPKAIRPPTGYLEASRRWVSNNRAVTAAVIAFVGTGAFIVWRRRRADRAKRRAKRAKNGARTEVVVLAGSPHSPLTRAMSLELERRGFIIYIPVNSVTEEQVVQGESRADIRALNLDITSPASTEEAIKKITNFLSTPHHAIANSPAHRLNLAAFILLPPPSYPVGAIANISSPDWSDIINSNLLAPFTTIKAFLPLLISHQSTLLFLTSSINSSLTSPSHAPESVVTGAVEQYISTLRMELSATNIVHFKLGHLDFGSASDEKKQIVLSHDLSRAEMTKMRLGEKMARGSPLRELHNDVFDVIVRSKAKQGTVFVGRGSRIYHIVGNWVPIGIVGWIMGSNRQRSPMLMRAKSGDSVDGSAEWEKVQ